MTDQIIQEGMTFPFEFISPVYIDIEETAVGVATIKGTLLAEGLSRNNHLYTIGEMASIAAQAEGKPIYTGTMTKFDPTTGTLRKGMHADIDIHRVGKILKAWLDKVLRKIKFIAEVVNTEAHPDIISKIKSGWGISIGGVALDAKYILTGAGKLITKVKDMILNHVQLISPKVRRGQQAAKVEGVEIQETMVMYCDPKTGICTTCNDEEIEETEPEPINITLELIV